MIRTTLLFLLLGLSAAASAQTVPDPRTGETIFTKTPYEEYLFQLALGADMLQTLEIHRHPNLIETNPIEGPHPPEGRIVGYFITAGVLHWLFTHELVRHHLPSSVIRMWEDGTIALEMSYVKHNASIGLHFYVP